MKHPLEGIEAYPLCWPEGWQRTRQRQDSPFKVNSHTRAVDTILHELELFGATNVIISTNIELRRDGLPYANRAQPSDSGVAVYWMRNGQRECLACDRWWKIEHNMWAICKSLEAMRGLKRWGADTILERAFMGFAQISYSPPASWWQTLGFDSEPRDAETVRRKRVELARLYHPDSGSEPDEERMKAVNHAVDQGLAILGFTQ